MNFRYKPVVDVSSGSQIEDHLQLLYKTARDLGLYSYADDLRIEIIGKNGYAEKGVEKIEGKEGSAKVQASDRSVIENN